MYLGFGIIVWLIPLGIMESKSQLDRWILSIYSNYEKLKSFMETFVP